MYTFERFIFRPVPWMLLILGIAFTITGRYIEAGILGTPGALLSISFKGINIDPYKQTYRKYDRFLWFYLGKWERFHKPVYVTVVRIKLSSRRTEASPIVSPGAGKSIRTYKVNLVVDSRKRYISLMRGKKYPMLEEGLKIAKALNIKLLDYTTEEKRWLA